jgi:hypothetical protein
MTTEYLQSKRSQSFNLLIDNKHDVSVESCKQFYNVYLPSFLFISYVQVTGYCCKQPWQQDENSQGRSMPHGDADGKI